MAACVGAQPRMRESMAEGNLVSVAAGTFRNGGGVVNGTYVIDPGTGLCFFSAHIVFGGATGPAGMAAIDCCHLRKIPEVQAALPALRESCDAAVPSTSTPAS